MESGQEARSDGELDWVEITPERELLREDLGFRIFLVQVKSETDTGKWLHNDPIDCLRTRIPEMAISDEDVRAVVLRANAERSANPRHRSEVWMVFPGSTNAVGVQYKHANEEGAVD